MVNALNALIDLDDGLGDPEALTVIANAVEKRSQETGGDVILVFENDVEPDDNHAGRKDSYTLLIDVRENGWREELLRDLSALRHLGLWVILEGSSATTSPHHCRRSDAP